MHDKCTLLLLLLSGVIIIIAITILLFLITNSTNLDEETDTCVSEWCWTKARTKARTLTNVLTEKANILHFPPVSLCSCRRSTAHECHVLNQGKMNPERLLSSLMRV